MTEIERCIRAGMATVFLAVLFGTGCGRTENTPVEAVLLTGTDSTADAEAVLSDTEKENITKGTVLYTRTGCDVFDAPVEGELLGLLTENSEVTVTGKEKDGWYEIVWEDGKNAYIQEEHLSMEKENQTEIDSQAEHYNEIYGGYAVDEDGNITPIPGVMSHETNKTD